MNDTVGKNYIATKGRDTLRKIVVVSPRVVLTECEYKELGWRYELWPTEPTETWLNFSFSDEQLSNPKDKMLLMANLLRVQLETERDENEMRLKEINKQLELIA
tara:strand:- start:2260 stop:2571 length:312 start_codon:yes stop_codon:yes gene_type:complete